MASKVTEREEFRQQLVVGWYQPAKLLVAWWVGRWVPGGWWGVVLFIFCMNEEREVEECGKRVTLMEVWYLC